MIPIDKVSFYVTENGVKRYITFEQLREMSMSKIKNLRQNIVVAAKAKLQEDKVKEATGKLKALYAQRDKASKVVRNLNREIEDYLQELEIDDDDESDDL